MTDKRILNGNKKIVQVKDIAFGKDAVMIAGPCSVESEEQIMRMAEIVKNCGAQVLRGGVFKPRTSPYAFQGLGKEGIKYMRRACDEHGLLMITELMDEHNLDLVMDYADIIQIGSRNMYNYSLLKIIGKTKRPVLLKRGMSATIKEWIMAAEYIAAEGNENIILCERGIRTFDTYTRNTLDLTAVPIMQQETGLPVIVDPSHGTGKRHLVEPMSKAAMALGADGLMIEVHEQPEVALSDGEQSLSPEEFKSLMENAYLPYK